MSAQDDGLQFAARLLLGGAAVLEAFNIAQAIRDFTGQRSPSEIAFMADLWARAKATRAAERLALKNARRLEAAHRKRDTVLHGTPAAKSSRRRGVRGGDSRALHC